MKIYENSKIRVTVPDEIVEDLQPEADRLVCLQGSQNSDQILRGLVLSRAMEVLGNRSEFKILEAEKINSDEAKKVALEYLAYEYLSNGHCRYALSEVLMRMNGGHQMSPGMAADVDVAKLYAQKRWMENPNEIMAIGHEMLLYSKNLDVSYRRKKMQSQYKIEILANLPKQIGTCRMS